MKIRASGFRAQWLCRGWCEQASGTRNRSGSFSTHCVLNRDLQNLRLSTVPGSFEYQAIFGWLPWMLMGQRPGHLVWRAHGLKLLSIDMLDPAVRRGFEAVFPALLRFTAVAGAVSGRPRETLDSSRARHWPKLRELGKSTSVTADRPCLCRCL